MVARIGPVTHVSAVANVHSVVRRSDLVDENDGSGLTVLAGRTDLLPAVGGRLVAGQFLTDATERFPVVVLGSDAAVRLGYDRLLPDTPPPQVSIGNRWFSVAGILAPVPLAPDLDQSVLSAGTPPAACSVSTATRPSCMYGRRRARWRTSARSCRPRSTRNCPTLCR
jgi:putative ABC transport system permease protein